MLEDHRGRITHSGGCEVFVSVPREVITAEAVPQNVGRKRQAGRFRDSFQRDGLWNAVSTPEALSAR